MKDIEENNKHEKFKEIYKIKYDVLANIIMSIRRCTTITESEYKFVKSKLDGVKKELKSLEYIEGSFLKFSKRLKTTNEKIIEKKLKKGNFSLLTNVKRVEMLKENIYEYDEEIKMLSLLVKMCDNGTRLAKEKLNGTYTEPNINPFDENNLNK